MWVEHPIDSHPFGSMSIGPPIPEIQYIQSLTLKFQGQGHSSRSQSRYNTLSTHVPFIPCQSTLSFLGYSFFKLLHWKFKVKVISEVKVESHNVGPTFSRITSLSFRVNRAFNSCVTTFSKFDLVKGQGRGWDHTSKSQCGSNFLSTHVPFVLYQSGIQFLSYDFFEIWPWKSRVKFMGEVTVQSHNVGLTSYRLTFLLFHVNRASHSWVTTFFTIWPWKSRVNVMGEVVVQSHNVGLISYPLTFLSPHVNRPSRSSDTAFWKFDFNYPGSISNDHDVAELQV